MNPIVSPPTEKRAATITARKAIANPPKAPINPKSTDPNVIPTMNKTSPIGKNKIMNGRNNMNKISRIFFSTGKTQMGFNLEKRIRQIFS